MQRDLQAEIKQTEPFPSAEAEAFLSLLRAADFLQACVANLLKPYDLSPTQYNALRILRGAGDQGLPCSELAERMINRDPDITRLVDRLQLRGLARRNRGRKDRRVIRACITWRGLELLRRLDRPVSELQVGLLGHLGPGQLQALIQTLDAIRNAGASSEKASV